MDDIDYSSLTALVVEDEHFVREVLTRLLHKLGLKSVREAANGEEALELLNEPETHFDVIICDLQMPGIDGIETLRHLATLHSDAGVILASGIDRKVLRTAEQLASAHGLRVLGALSKPITVPSLKALLSKLVQRDWDKPRRPDGQPAVTAEELEAAIEAGQVVPFFQPKVAIADRKVEGVEVLARWRHPERGLVPPGAFIPMAEETGLIEPMTESVMGQAIQQAARWRDAGYDLRLAVNVAMQSLCRLDLPDKVIGIADRYGVPPQVITLEVTESGLMEDVKSALDVLARLRMRGIDLSIDDFGTGYSTFTQLKRIPFTELKIDRSFVQSAVRDPESRAILESSVGLGQRLGLQVVAEGVETQEEWDLVAGLGCQLVQGYLISRPLPAEELLQWLEVNFSGAS